MQAPESPFAPENAEEAANGILALAETRQQAYIGTTNQQKSGIEIQTHKLTGIKEYAPEDMYITVGAGTPLKDIQEFLTKDNRYLPLASPWPQATIGGLIAANINAPLRMRHGSIRDILLSATVVLPDGRIIRTGRPIVKNVAGYDITKLFVGSNGTLGLMTDVTLKISVPPRCRKTLLYPIHSLDSGLNLANIALRYTLVASGLVLYNEALGPGTQKSPYTLAYSAEGLEQDVDAELSQIQEALRQQGAPTPHITEHWSATNAWEALLQREGAQVRIGVPPGNLSDYINKQHANLDSKAFLADFNSGHIYTTNQDEHSSNIKQWVEQMRQLALQEGGYAIITTLPSSLEGTLSYWGYQPDGIQVMRALKQRWDPQGLLRSRTDFLSELS
ncbi:FAD-binding oxidoreductase [Ktedonospora formicarum]|nr:FAD-binding oxidoreductase [Ktedonospora formicarum]